MLPESSAILGGGNEGLDHLGSDEVAVELIQLRQPEVIACVVRILWVIRIASQNREIGFSFPLPINARVVPQIRHATPINSPDEIASRRPRQLQSTSVPATSGVKKRNGVNQAEVP